MLPKILTGILSVLLAIETVYVVMHRDASTKRFRLTEKDGAVALDTATGRLCKTFPTKPEAIWDDADAVFLVGLPECSQMGFFSRWRPSGRFQLVGEDDYDGRLAWDAATGRLCRTVPVSLLDTYVKRKGLDEAAIGTNGVTEGVNKEDAIRRWRLEHPESENLTFTQGLSACWK